MSTRLESIKSIDILMFLAVVVITLVSSPVVQAQSFSVIHNFAGSDGSGPLAGLVMDANQNLYGTTNYGGQHSYGVVFKANRNGEEAVVHSFAGGANDGAYPEDSLIIDTAGNLYGTTFNGGLANAGTVFKLSSKGVIHILYSFAGGNDGANPIARLAIDKNGNLYGTTSAGGTSGNGTVFAVSPAGKHTVLYSFGSGTDGTIPFAGVTLDAKGNLYGTTSAGGSTGNGTVFELKRSSSGWTEIILHNFELQDDGGTPFAGLVFDNSGNLYGAATQGGVNGTDGGGTIFELRPAGGSWTFTVLYGLYGWNISGTFRDLLFDSANGVIYGTTHCDGSYEAGTVYSLAPSSGSWSYTELYTFTGGTDGLYSFSNLVMDKSGNLYGTTNEGGATGNGVVFKVAP
jgi:uncharacterized repeat protein (TIGR03803 family)